MSGTRFDPTGDHGPLAWLALAPPVLIAIFLLDGFDVVWAIPVGLAVAWLAHQLSNGDIEVTLVAGVLGLLFVGSAWVAAAGIVLVGAILLAIRLRSVWALLIGAVGLAAPSAVGPWVIAATVALLVAWSGPSGTRRPGDSWLVLIVAIGVTIAGALVFESPWAGVVGLLAGGVARATGMHPANLRSGRLLATGGALAAVAPPAAMLVFASLDRAPPLPAMSTLTAAFGLAALGLLVFAFGLGAELALRSSGAARGVFLGAGLALGASVAAAGVADGLGAATAVAMVLWPLVCPAIAVGILRSARHVGLGFHARTALWGLVILAAVAVRVLR